MIIIKFLVFSMSWFLVFKQLKKKYRGLFDNLNTQLLTLPITDIFGFFTGLLYIKLTDNSILSKISSPLNLDWRVLCDSNLKKAFLLLMISAVSMYRWLQVVKRVFYDHLN